MTNEEWDQLAQQLNPEQKDKLISILCGPEEDWSEVDREIVLRLYGVDPRPDPALAKEIVGKIIRDKREQGEEVEQELIGLLDQLERRTADASRQSK